MAKRKRRRKNFLNDYDGLSAKDYLLLISTGVFFTFIVIGLITLLFDRQIDEMYIELLEMITVPLSTIVVGVMGVNGVEIYTNKRYEANLNENKSNVAETTNEEDVV